MRTGDLVCSPKLAYRLKQLGVKQDSHFFWVEDIGEGAGWSLLCVGDEVDYLRDKPDYVADSEASAFTAGELGDKLPPRLVNYEQTTVRSAIGWHVNYGAPMTVFAETSEADARAAMLIHLIEKKLVKP